MGQTARTIAIVGPDGCGKTTQARLLVERLRATGYDARYVHALYYLSDAVPFADRLRRRFGPRRTRTRTTEMRRPSGAHRLSHVARRVCFGAFGFLFALITIAIVGLRSRGERQVVVFDRYYQQFLYDVYGPAGVPLSRLLPQPDHTVYLDADLPTVRTRMGTADRAVDPLYYATVIDLYDDCSTAGWLSFRAELPAETLHERIFEAGRFDVDRSGPDSRPRRPTDGTSPLDGRGGER